jgi:hypothetical protein
VFETSMKSALKNLVDVDIFYVLAPKAKELEKEYGGISALFSSLLSRQSSAQRSLLRSRCSHAAFSALGAALSSRCSAVGAALSVQRSRCSALGAALSVQRSRCSALGAALSQVRSL